MSWPLRRLIGPRFTSSSALVYSYRATVQLDQVHVKKQLHCAASRHLDGRLFRFLSVGEAFVWKGDERRRAKGHTG